LVLRYRVIGNNLSLTFGIAFCFNLKFNLYRKSPLQSAQPLPLHQKSTKNCLFSWARDPEVKITSADRTAVA
jgi:hypothetical protein